MKLQHLDFNKDFNLFGDATNFGLGGCLDQADGNGTKINSFSVMSS